LRGIAEEREAGFTRPVVFFESPHRLIKTLVDIESIFGAEIEVFVAREITKKFEQFYHGTAGAVREQIAEQFPEDIQGELVLVISSSIV
jgi:16S rRNA (cytidine1402-2'-O)-methyltransferase